MKETCGEDAIIRNVTEALLPLYSGISTHHLPLHTFVSDVKTLLHNMETHLLPAAGSNLKAHINDVLYGQREDINKEAKRRCQEEVDGTRP